MPVDGAKPPRIWASWIAFVAPFRPRVFQGPSRGWRPMALRPPFLAALLCLLLTMFMIVEGLRQYSAQKGGLHFFDDTDDVTRVQSFMFNYMPIIIALVLLTVWTIADFDVLRLEPYYQLSRPEGVPATVLFINYNFGQTILTPINAARRRHWVVLWVSILTLLIRMILPALQSTLFELREVKVTNHVQMRSWPTLADLETQGKWMATQANNTVDNVLSSSDTVHRTRSKDFAIAPVEIPEDDRDLDTLWNLDQTIYWAKLMCDDVYVDHNMTVTINENTNNAEDEPRISWTASGNDPGDKTKSSGPCQLSFNYSSIFFPETDFLQVRYWEPAISQVLESDYPIQHHAFTTVGCDPYDLYGMMITVNITKDAPNDPQYSASGTAFACDIKYQKADADVQMHSNSSISNIKIHPATTRTLTASEFNIAQFNSLLSQHSPYTSDMLFIRENATTGDRIVTELPVISQQLGEFEPLLVLDTAMIMSQDQFERRIGRDVKQTFVLTLGRLFDPDSGAVTLRATSTTTRVAIAVVAFAALFSELILGLACLTTVYLIFLYQSRESFLQGDPGSIGAMCSIAADVFHPANFLANSEANFHQSSTRQLNRMLRNARCYWRQGPYGNRLEILAEDGSPVQMEQETTRTRVDPMPHFLVVPFFIIEFLALAAIIILMALVVSSLARDGRFKHLSQSDSSALQVVLSFLPSVVASSVGSLCTSIHRNLAVLEPWVHLQRGMAAAGASLSLNYASQSPLMVFVKCVRGRRFLLGLVSIACVVNLVLTVVVGGLFNQEMQTSTLPSSDLLMNYSQSTFWRNDFAAEFTEYDLIQTSITSGVPMLPWTSANQSFIPIRILDGDPSVLYGAETLGISASLECAPLAPEDGLRYNKSSGSSYWQYSTFADKSVECIAPMPVSNKDEGIALAIHFLSPIDKVNPSENVTDVCETSTVLVVGQWDYMANTPITDNNSVALHCEPKINMQDFAITFDNRGQINSHELTNGSITEGVMYDNATVSLGQFNKVFAAIPDSYVGNTTSINGTYNISSYDWAGFLVARLYERADPDFEALDIDIMTDLTRVVYQWVYSTYFSIWRHIYLEQLEHPVPAKNSTVIQSTWTMVPSVPCLAVALIIIAFDALVVLLVFGTRRGRFSGPRMPRSIGAVIPWIAHSQMLRDFTNTHHWTNTQRRAHLSTLDKRYTFRMFMSPDSRWRFAVDEEPPGGQPPDSPPPDQLPPGQDASKSTSIQLQELFSWTGRFRK